MRASLRDEVREFVLEHGPSTAPAVALGVRARRFEVDAVLAGAGFCRVSHPEGASPRPAYFGLSQRVPRALGGKSRAAAMLDVLRDGRRHSRDEIFRLAGRYFLTNNAASELRAAGYDVRHGREGHVDVYWLCSPAVRPHDVAAPASVSGYAGEAAA